MKLTLLILALFTSFASYADTIETVSDVSLKTVAQPSFLEDGTYIGWNGHNTRLEVKVSNQGRDLSITSPRCKLSGLEFYRRADGKIEGFDENSQCVFNTSPLNEGSFTLALTLDGLCHPSHFCKGGIDFPGAYAKTR